ncbi:E3 ubiquitin-protein ligase RNF213 [Gastrophryne carolinensis]
MHDWLQAFSFLVPSAPAGYLHALRHSSLNILQMHFVLSKYQVKFFVASSELFSSTVGIAKVNTADNKKQQQKEKGKQQKTTEKEERNQNSSEEVKNKSTEPQGETTTKVQTRQQRKNAALGAKAEEKPTEEIKHIERELNPENLITVYFHVIVSKNFNLKTEEDKVVVKAGNIEGFSHWEDEICNLYCSQEIKNHGFLYEGHTQISKKNLDRVIPYKYVIVQKNKEEYEYIYNADVQGQKPINRCLRISTKLMDKEGILLLGGDLNIPLNPSLDTSSGRSAVPLSKIKQLKKALLGLQLVDTWRALHGSKKDYSFYSHAANSYSRIDYLLMSHHALDWDPSAWIGLIVWSDHAPIFVSIQLPGLSPSCWSWRLNDNLLGDAVCSSAIETAIEHFFNDHKGDNTPLPYQWEALKCVIRGELIKHGSRLKRERASLVKQTLQLIRSLEADHKANQTNTTLLDLTRAREKLQKLYDQSYLRYRDRGKARLYESANKCGRLLTRSLHPRSMITHIPSLQRHNGTIAQTPSDIADTFRDFYASLYNLQGSQFSTSLPGATEEISDYIAATPLPTIPGPESTNLEMPFSEQEIARAIKDTPSGKCPGPDGYSPKFYKHFGPKLIHFLTKTFNAINEECPFPKQSLEATISVIPKPGKDASLCSSYRPISLINVDLKIYAKIISLRLQPLLPDLIHLDQVGFVPGREARDNTNKLFNLISHITLTKTPACLLSCDAEKAFDRVNWAFMKASLQQIGVGPNLLSKILALYTNPTAKVRANGLLSASFPISNGTRQGCPLSPLLYVITMEHLAVAIRNNPSIKRIQVADRQHKASLFADDLLLHLTSPLTSFPSILAEFNRFSRVSNFKINHSKSEALNLSLPPREVKQLELNFPFKWQPHAIKYLGIQIPSNLSTIYELNYKPLVTKIQSDLDKYTTKPFSWFGRINILKMDILPKFLYLFQTAPIKLPSGFFRKLQAAFSKFQVSGDRINNTPQVALLSLIPGPLSALKRGVLRHFISAMRAIIPRHWKSQDVPTLMEWVQELESICRMEELTSDMKDTNELYLRLSARGLALLTALRQWSVDVASKKSLTGLPLQGERLFEEHLDDKVKETTGEDIRFAIRQGPKQIIQSAEGGQCRASLYMQAVFFTNSLLQQIHSSVSALEVAYAPLLYFAVDWHQYDDVCMKENHSFFDKWKVWQNKYKLIYDAKMKASEVMISSIFSVLVDCDEKNLTNFFTQLLQFYNVSINSLVFGDRVYQWTTHGFSAKEVLQQLIIGYMPEMGNVSKAELPEANIFNAATGLRLFGEKLDSVTKGGDRERHPDRVVNPKKIGWVINYPKSHITPSSKICKLILDSLNKMCEPFIAKKDLQEKEVKNKLTAGLVCLVVAYSYPLPISKEHLANICSLLCLDEMPREKMIFELQAAKNLFSKVQCGSWILSMDTHIRQLCQQCMDQDVDLWVWVLPVLHTFSFVFKPQNSLSMADVHQEDVWAGLEGIAYEKVKTWKSTNDLLSKMIKKKYLLQADQILIRSWLCVIPINHIVKFVEELPIKINDVLQACCYRLPEVKNYQKQSIKDILKILLHKIGQQGKFPNTEIFLRCSRASLGLHNIICNNQILKNDFELPCLSAEMILTLLRIFYLSELSDETNTETELKQTETEKVLPDALKLTKQWIEDLYGHRFNLSRYRFVEELRAWNKILKIGEGVTPKWTDTLLPILLRKIKQEEPLQQILLYCKEQDLFNNLYPSIGKCFEDCAIEAVHLACQYEHNILSQLTSYNLENFGRLVSSVIKNSWPKNEDGSYVKDENNLFKHLLEWKDALHIFKLYGTDSRIISQLEEEIQELVALSESVFLEARKNVMDGQILFKHMEWILENKEQFLAICKLKIERKENISLNDIHKVLTWRKEELDTVKRERKCVESLLKMVQSVQHIVKVNITDIQKKHSENMGPQKLNNILPARTLASDHTLERMMAYYELDASAADMAKELHRLQDSHVFTICLEEQAQVMAENESSNDTEFTIDETVDELFIPCLEQCNMIYNDLKSGEVTFEIVKRFFADFKNNYKKLEDELQILCCLHDADRGKWISVRVKQIEQYHQLHVAFRSAKVVYDLKDFLKLPGDFQTLEKLLDFAKDFENYKKKTLSYISNDVMQTRKLLSQIDENHIQCLEEVLSRKDFFYWVKEALKDVNELKVFVDLASISAGENDMDVDRVACFHDAVLGYSPLLYEVTPAFTFDDFMQCLEKLWKALKSDPALPKKLRDSARHLEWLKTVKESHGSVELSSLSLATTINKNGIYIIKAPEGSKKVTPDSVLQLILPDNEADLNGRIYTLDELKELLNKLMLMSGKGDQGNLEVDKFSEIFSDVQRLSESFIDLYLAGNMLFRTWEVEIFCSDHAKSSVLMKFNVDAIDAKFEGQGPVTDMLPEICKTMETFLEEWLTFIDSKRSQHYFLSYYTSEQLVYLCQQYQSRDISEEALMMLSFVKPDCTKIDTIDALFFPKSGSLMLASNSQPDMMQFDSDLCDCTTVSEKLELVWKFSMDYTSKLFPGCLDIDTLGRSLAALADLNKQPVIRDLHPSLLPDRPNLILCPPSEILSCALAVYMHSSAQPLPSYDEVLLCSPHTTFEEMALFFRRCLTRGYSGKKIYSLIYADQLSYDVGNKSEQLFQQLQTQSIDHYNLVVICNSDREHCYIPSVFSQFKVHMIPQQPLAHIQRYLCTHFSVHSNVVSASPVFKNGMSAGIVSSKRAGVGKSLYVKRLHQKLTKNISSKKPVLKVIRMIKPQVDERKVLETLLPFLDRKLKSCPIIFHIDITSSVISGITEFLFKLLVLHYLMDSEGRIWKRLPSHLYIIEILESPDVLFGKQFKSVPQMVQNSFIDFFPKILCCSPKEVMTRSMVFCKTDCEDPGMDIEEFRSECFQRPYQYLIRFDQNLNLDTFVYREGHVEGDPATCLQIFLLKCGIVDPSWSELRNFAWFLNLQLKDCESSVFCNHEHVGDTLQGFKNFVVDFMILMAKDFATPSLHIADQSPGRQEVNLDGVSEQDLAPFLMRKKWESEPHPYIFFNDDHVSMTFIGFHLQPNNAGGVDAINPKNNTIIRNNIMSMQLYEALRLQRVPFNIDFDQLPRHEKISRLCMVLGIQWPIDPDETYEITMDNILKILAIKMRFRCGIPVVIMGETGCGKTRLIKFLCHLCKGFVETENMKLVKVHGGTTAETIYQKILEAQEIAKLNRDQGCETILFFDEANTTDAISSIKEALCDHTVEGEPLQKDSGLQIIAACNPYRKHTDDMIRRLESAGLGYRVKSNETKEKLGSIPLRQLVYRVHALPPSMMPLVWDFGQLNNETEKKYIQQIVQRMAKEISISSNDIVLLTSVLSASQSYMRMKNDECSFVSLRDVERCIEVFKWFHTHHGKLMKQPSILQRGINIWNVTDKVAWSLVLAVGVCYHASLETKAHYRMALSKLLPQPYKDPYNILRDITVIQDLFLAGVQLRDTIARNQALKENLFMMVICIELKIPLFLVGKPGSSKSLAKTIVADAMQGQAAHTDLYKDLKQIHLVSFQCSPHSTPEGIIGTFRHCARFQEGKNLNEYVSVVVLDEIGLAEDSPKMPLKTLHPLLEDGCIDDDTSPHKKVGFIGISNWALDPAKMNRGIFVSRGDPNKKELIESAKGICASDNLILRKVSQHFHSFSEAYLKLCKEQEKEFFGLRDFYSLIKMVFAFKKHSQENLTLDQIARAVLRNFSGKDDLKVLDIFLKEEANKLSEINTIDLVMENVKSDSDDCRYLLILTKNYAALQILQQAILKENQQPEIIFGSSFPKDQEYSQICRNINRVKNCMETGKMVILLNLQNLYESLYDALNQYYVYLAGQKYVDLGLGTHRVKCRVHPKFRLIVIEEKEVVHKDFPIPLINRLEKHYLDMNTFLKKEHRVIVNELEMWVEDFTEGNLDHTIGNPQTYSPSDVFIGYHSDTCASVVLQVTENMTQYHLDAENITDVKNKAIQVLLSCATPDSVIRLGRKEIINEYFKNQKHGSFLDFLFCHVTSGYRSPTIFTEITTFSRLLTSADKKGLEAELRNHVGVIEILSLQQFDTEFSFLKKIRSLLESSSGNVILIIQTDFEEGSQGANLVASAKYSAVNEINKVDLSGKSLFVYYITKLPRMQGGTTYVGFRGGLWQSIHIDDLRKSKDMIADVTALQNLSISQLFCVGDKREQMKKDVQKEDTETEMEVEIQDIYGEREIQPSTADIEIISEIDINIEDLMETEYNTPEDQEMETDVSQCKRDDMLDTTMLIRSCIQNAIGLLRDDDNVESRSTKRIEILINILTTENDIKRSFLKMVKLRLHGMLKMQEATTFHAAQWVKREAGNQKALQEAGTFRQTLWNRVQAAITPLMSQILSVADRNANLELLFNKDVDDAVKCLWMYIFDKENLLFIDSNNSSQNQTILVKNYMNIAVFGENAFPFSWRIKDYLEDIWTQAQHIGSGGGPENKFLEIFSQTDLGKYISTQDDDTQDNFFLLYKRDFLLMTMSITSAEELQVLEFALSACVEELRSSLRGAEVLFLLPWVHIGYSTFQHRLQNLNRILTINPSVVNSLLQRIRDPKPTIKYVMVLDIFAAIACLETLKHSVQTSDHQDWIQQVKNIQVPIELICSEGYLQRDSSWCETGIKDIRKHWSCVFSMALFMEHLMEDNQDAEMQGIIRDHTLILGRCLENFVDIKSDKPFMAVLDVLQKFRDAVSNSVSRFGIQMCAICRDYPSEPVCLDCNHVFCQGCLKQWLDTRNTTCPMCKAQLPEPFIPTVSIEIRDGIQKYNHFRKQCNGFFVSIVCNLCFKDNTPPQDDVIGRLLSFLFTDTDSGSCTRSLSPFEDAVDKTPVIRSVILKLLLKYSFDNIMDYVQGFLNRVKESKLFKIEDTVEVYLLFLNCLEDSLFEQKQKVQSDKREEYLNNEIIFLQAYCTSSKNQRANETCVQFLQDVARVRQALDMGAEMLSVNPRELIHDDYVTCVKDICSKSGNDWFRIYLIRKLANLDGIDVVQQHFKDPSMGWLFPPEILRNQDTQTSHIDPFLVCGESYKVLRDGVGRAMIESKEEWVAKAIQECKKVDQELAVQLLLAVFREITLYYGGRNGLQAPEHETVKTFIKNVKVLENSPLNRFVETLLNNHRPFIQAVPNMKGSQVTIFGLAIHMAATLLSGNCHLFAPLKNLSFSTARMQNSFLPTMPEDMLAIARTAVTEQLHWYDMIHFIHSLIDQGDFDFPAAQPLIKILVDVAFKINTPLPQVKQTCSIEPSVPDQIPPSLVPLARSVGSRGYSEVLCASPGALTQEPAASSWSQPVLTARSQDPDSWFYEESDDDDPVFEIHATDSDDAWTDFSDEDDKAQEGPAEISKVAQRDPDRQGLEQVFEIKMLLKSTQTFTDYSIPRDLSNNRFSWSHFTTTNIQLNLSVSQWSLLYCGECGQPMQIGRCPDCGVNVGGQNHAPLQGFQRIQQDVDRTQTGHVLGDPERLGATLAPDRDIAAPAFIILRIITHLSMLVGSEEDAALRSSKAKDKHKDKDPPKEKPKYPKYTRRCESCSVLLLDSWKKSFCQTSNINLRRIIKPAVTNVAHFLFRYIEKDLEYLRTSLGKSADETTTVIHLVIHQMLQPQQPGHWAVNFDEVWSTKQMRNNWEKHFVSIVIAPVLRTLDRDLVAMNNNISQDERISSNPIVKVVYGDPLRSGEKMDLPRNSHVHCSKIWSCRERISIEYMLNIVQQQDEKDNLPLLWKFLEKESELQLVKFLPNMLKLQKELVKNVQNCRDIGYKTIADFLESIRSGGARRFFEKSINEFMLAWNHLRFSLQTNGEIKLPEYMGEEILTLESNFEFLLPRRQGLGLAATALTSYLIALHNSFIYALEKHGSTKQKYSIKAAEVMDLHVISYEMEKDLLPIILSNCQYSLESGKETFQEFDFLKIQHQIIARLFQGKPIITMAGLPTLILSQDRKYENLFTDVKKKVPQGSLSNSAIDVISKDLNAFSDVCEALNIVDISLGFLATSGGDQEMSFTKYVEDILQMGEQSNAHVLEALKRCHLKNTIAVWQLLTALKSQHLLHLKRDPFTDVDKAYKQKLDNAGQHALNIFLEQNGTNLFLLELHEMIMLKLRKPQSADDFPPHWLLRDVLGPLLDAKNVIFTELESDFPEQIALGHCIEAWKVAASKKWNRI